MTMAVLVVWWGQKADCKALKMELKETETVSGDDCQRPLMRKTTPNEHVEQEKAAF